VAKELGPDVPLHFSAFHPDWKMDDIPATPPATLARARRIAMDAGLHYVYTGNVHDKAGDATLLPRLRQAGDPARLVPHPRLRTRRHGALPALRHRHCGALRKIRQALRPAADSGQAAS
jgi:pyruvate formate lyase activating enzyme